MTEQLALLIAMPPPQDVRFIPCPTTQPEIGMGFNSETGSFLGPALSFEVSEVPGRADGQDVSAYAEIMESSEQLVQEMGASFSAEGRYGLASVSAKVDYSNKTSFNSTSSFVLVKCVVTNSIIRGRDFKLKSDLAPLVTAARIHEFYAGFGDYFVRGLKTGGELYAVYCLTSTNTEIQESLSATLKAEVNGLAASGAFQAAYNTASERKTTSTSISISFFQSSGLGDEASVTLTPQEVLGRLKAFPQIVANHSKKWEAEVVTYAAIPVPIPSKLEKERLNDCLADADIKRQQYTQFRNDAEFAKNNPKYFIDLPDAEVLTAAYNDYTKALNAVMKHAREMAQGRIEPSMFELSSCGITTLPRFALVKANVSNHLELFVGTWMPGSQECPINKLEIASAGAGELRAVASFGGAAFADTIGTWDEGTKTLICSFKPRRLRGRGGLVLPVGQEYCLRCTSGIQLGQLLGKILVGTTLEISFGGAAESDATFQMVT